MDQVLSELHLNPRCDIADIGSHILIRTTDNTITLEGQTVPLLRRVLLPRLKKGTILSEIITVLKNYDQIEILALIKLLQDSNCIVDRKPVLPRKSWFAKQVNNTVQSSWLATNPNIMITQGSLDLEKANQVWDSISKIGFLLLGFRVDGAYYLAILPKEHYFNPSSVWRQLIRIRHTPIHIAYQRHITDHPLKDRPFFTEEETLWICSTLKQVLSNLPYPLSEPILYEFEPSGCSYKRLTLVRSAPEKPQSTKLLLDSLLNCLKHDTGIVRNLVKMELPDYQMEELVYAAQYARPWYSTRIRDEDNWCWGTDIDLIAAQIKAIMEAVERHCNGVWKRKEQIINSWNNVKSSALDPSTLVGFHSWQYQHGLDNTPFDKDVPMRWQPALNISTGEECLVLADCVFYPIYVEKGDKRPYTWATSSGAAAHTSLTAAIENGFRELVEREAFVIHWYNQITPPQVPPELLPRGVQNKIRNLNRFGYKVFILDLTLDLLSVYATALLGDLGRPAYIMGAGCDYNPLIAISKSLSEAEKVAAVSSLRNWQAWIEDKKTVVSHLDHMHFYFDSKNLPNLEFLLKGAVLGRISNRDLPRNVVDLARLAGLEVVVVDLTTEEVEKTGLGVKAVKVFVPGMVPITFGEGCDPLAMPRLTELPYILGLDNERKNFYLPTKFPPHPFN